MKCPPRIRLTSTLRFADLQRPKVTIQARQVLFKIPAHVYERMEEVADHYRCALNDAVIALLNEGLDEFAQRRSEYPGRQGRATDTPAESGAVKA